MTANGENEKGATVDGLDNLLGPHRGTVDIGFIHPDFEPLFSKIAHQLEHLLLILARIADEYVRTQRVLFAFPDFFDERLVLGVICIITDEEMGFKVERQYIVFECLLRQLHEFIKSNFH